MTLEEIFKTNPELLDTPEVQNLIAYVQEQQNHNTLVNQNHMNFRNKVTDIVFASDQFILNGASGAFTIRKIIDIL